ncbi:hypothetical protein FHP25_05225 [Vineibacter terrae]|uniref:Cytochrome P450 n=1 Tax=Vineibacter terrae TaxID=2586908 RepID=A0A5C8PSU5_9HYPH|nr:hypothetical protein [Vineibacter terrae]TXL80430.1 hypothetical protein FHP25_05225 [Vineibacter terrae]
MPSDSKWSEEKIIDAQRMVENARDIGDLLPPSLAHAADAFRGSAPALDAAGPLNLPDLDQQRDVVRSADVIRVTGKERVMEVFEDAAQHYSVSGYAERMEDSLGLIYLGLDGSDKRYGEQAWKSNAAISAVAAEEAFRLAFDKTRNAIDQQGIAPGDAEKLSVRVLAALCTHWFGLPDGVHMMEGGFGLDTAHPPKCPGDFAFLSHSITELSPDAKRAWSGMVKGHLLRLSVRQFVTGHHRDGTTPDGTLTRALFKAFPGQADLLARTIVGVMMGMLPTVQLNLLAVLEIWKRTNRYDALAAAFAAHPSEDLYKKACAVLEEPLMQAMQMRPTPGSVWRTAAADHLLNGEKVSKGDRIHVSIESATQEDLRKGVTDVTPIFGGSRGREPHPTHACPGYRMGMGILLGIIAGAMTSPAPVTSAAPVAPGTA